MVPQNGTYAQRALDSLARAEKRARSPGLLGSLFGGPAQLRQEEAAELFTAAGNLFKLGKDPQQAGRAYWMAAQCALRAGDKLGAGSELVKAGKVLTPTDPEEAIACFREAAELCTDEGRFSIAARHLQTVAELCEVNGKIDEAIEALEQAAEFFEGEHSPSSAQRCLIRVAEMNERQENYDRAVQLYEQVVTGVLDKHTSLARFSVKNFFLRACLCYLASGDDVAARQALDKYSGWEPTFSQTREATLLTAIIAATEKYDTDGFIDGVAKYEGCAGCLGHDTVRLLTKAKSHVAPPDSEDLS